MALIKCPECGKEISDKSDKCINCGYPIRANNELAVNEETDSAVVITQKNKKPIFKRIWFWVAIVAVVVAATVAVVFLPNREEKPSLSEEKPSLSNEEIYNSIAPSTVEFHGLTLDGSVIGTGFFIDDSGTVITNYHVIEGCLDADIVLQDGTEYSVMSVLGYDKSLDVAILSTSCMQSSPIVHREEVVSTGEKVYTLGSSLGLTGTFAEGIISSANRKINGQNFIQTTAPISSGNSGGPLVDKNGKVIGITTAAFEEGQNLNLAVPIVLALNIKRDNKIGGLKKIFIEQYTSGENISFFAELAIESYIENPDAETRANLIEKLEDIKNQLEVWIEKTESTYHSRPDCRNIKGSTQACEGTVDRIKSLVGILGLAQCGDCW